MTAVAVAAVCVAAVLYAVEWCRPPQDAAAHRRLMRELRRHPVEIWEQDTAA